MKILGIDPGLAGGLAIISDTNSFGVDGGRPQIVCVADIPTTGEKAKRRVDAGAVIAWLHGRQVDHAVIERAQAMPDQGASSGFIYGRAVGALEAIVEGMQIPLTVVEPMAWKKAHGLLKRGKEDSRQRALRLFPGAKGLERKKDHGRAESCLLAWYGLMLLRGGVRGAIDEIVRAERAADRAIEDYRAATAGR